MVRLKVMLGLVMGMRVIRNGDFEMGYVGLVTEWMNGKNPNDPTMDLRL